MTSCSICRVNKQSHYFAFAKNKTSFYDATNQCVLQGGTLAINITTEEYKKFKQCCASSMQYWIGLKYDSVCRNRREPYQWLNSTTCHNGSPLSILNKGRIENRCQAVTITLNLSKRQLPEANRVNCDTRQFYVCRFPWIKDDSNLTGTSFLLPKLPFLKHNPNSNPQKYKPLEKNFQKPTNNSFRTKDFTIEKLEYKNSSISLSTVNANVIGNAYDFSILAGVLGSISILLFGLFLFIYCCYFKKRRSVNFTADSVKKFFIRSPTSEQQMEKNRIYSKLVALHILPFLTVN